MPGGGGEQGFVEPIGLRLVLIEYQDSVALVLAELLVKLLKLKRDVNRACDPQVAQRIGIVIRQARLECGDVDCGKRERVLSLVDPLAEEPEDSLPDFRGHAAPAAMPIEDARAFQLLQGLRVDFLHKLEDLSKFDARTIEALRVGNNADHHLHFLARIIQALVRVAEFHQHAPRGRSGA